MAWAAIGAAAVTVVGGALTSGGSGGGATMGANPQQYDPFQSYRPQYGVQLNQLMADPQSVTKMPGYQWELQQGQQATQRAMAAQGKNLSGAEMLALQQQGQGLAGQYYDRRLQTLMQLSGAGQSAASGYAAGVSGSQNYMQNMTGLAGVGTALGTAFGNWMNTPSGGTQQSGGVAQSSTGSMQGFYTAPTTNTGVPLY